MAGVSRDAGTYRGRETIDLDGEYVAPGFIDAHVHIESSLMLPAEYANAVMPHGTTAVVSDPHEIANVHGLAGIKFMLAASEGLPLHVFMMLSSCVPATHMETSGARLNVYDLASLLDEGGDHQAARAWVERAAALGDPLGWTLLGEILLSRTPLEVARGLALVRAATAAGNARAAHLAALLAAAGVGQAPNWGSSRRPLPNACATGSGCCRSSIFRPRPRSRAIRSS